MEEAQQVAGIGGQTSRQIVSCGLFCLDVLACAGRSAERPVLSEEEIASNVAGIQAILEDLLQPKEEAPGGPPAILNNLVSSSSKVSTWMHDLYLSEQALREFSTKAGLQTLSQQNLRIPLHLSCLPSPGWSTGWILPCKG